MLKFAFVAMTAAMLTAGMPETPSDLLKPLDPALGSHARQPASPTRGLKPFAPSEPRDWLQMNRRVTPSDEQNGGMHMMPGMGEMR
jgi:hypothetical protein